MPGRCTVRSSSATQVHRAVGIPLDSERGRAALTPQLQPQIRALQQPPEYLRDGRRARRAHPHGINEIDYQHRRSSGVAAKQLQRDAWAADLA